MLMSESLKIHNPRSLLINLLPFNYLMLRLMVLSESFAQVLRAMMSQVCLTQQKTFHFPMVATGLLIELLETAQVHVTT